MNTTIETGKSVKSVASIFAEMTDQRKPKGIRYEFQPLLILLSLAKLCRQDTPSEISDWVLNRSSWLREKLGLDWKRMPSLSTWQRLIAENIAVSEFDELVGRYFQAFSSGEQELLNLDGKVLRRTVSEETDRQLHLLALQTSESNAVVEQTALAEGENEISAAKRLIERAELRDRIVSGDAIFAQTELSNKVVEKGGAYLWKLRANQGQIYEQAKNHFTEMADKYAGRASSLEKGHGRIEQRECLTSFRLAHQIEFPYLEQVFRIIRKSKQVKTGKQSQQTIYGITSLSVEEFGAEQLLSLTRKHWSIENGLHYRRDVTFKEDQVKQKSLAGGRVLAVMNNLIIGILRKLGWENIARSRRHFSAMIDEALSLILFPIKLLL